VLLQDRLAGALAIILVCSYPLVATLSHVPLLDLGYLAFTTLATLGLAVFDKNKNWRSATILGLTLGLGATSKQIAVLFLIVPCLVLLARAGQKRDWLQVGQLAYAAIFPAAGLLIWMIPNHKALADWRDYYKDDPSLKGNLFSAFIDHSSHYAGGLPIMLSPGLAVLALVSIIYLWRARPALLKALYIPLMTAICGLLLTSCVALNRPEERYVVPVAIAAALVSATALSQWFKNTKALIALASFFIAFTLVQFILLNYTPYPLPANENVVQTIYKIAGHASGQELVEPRPSPTPPGDKWGQEWAVSQIEKLDKGHKTTLNIMPSTPDLSVHTIDLVCIFAGTQIEPSTFRQFTLHGDLVRYDEQAIKYYDWYLLKTGYQGTPMADQQSKDNYEKICRFIETPPYFNLLGEKDLPDGSKLKLYHHAK